MFVAPAYLRLQSFENSSEQLHLLACFNEVRWELRELEPLTGLVFIHRSGMKNKLFLNVQINGNGCEDSSPRCPLLSSRTSGVVPATAPYTLPGTPTLLEEHGTLRSTTLIIYSLGV